MLGLEKRFHTALTWIVAWTGSVALPAALTAQNVFPDKALETAVRREVFEKRYNTEPITADDVKNISQVIGIGKGIKSLEGMQHCKALMKLDLANNEIVDLGPLKELKLLQSIDLSKNKIESIEPLALLVNSQYVQLSSNVISDIGPLKDMSNLRSLYIASNKIKSIEVLAGMKKMWTLDLSGNPVDNLTPISQLKFLDTMYLDGCGVKSLEFLRKMNPSRLKLANNPIEDFGPLVETCELDAKGDNRMAQFLRLHIDESVMKSEKHATALERLRSMHVRINPPN
jgi:internalin A